jgi:azurin
MANSTHSTVESGGSFWAFVNKLIGFALVLFAGFWGVAFVIGGINAAHKIRTPVEAAAPAAPATADAAKPAEAAPTAAAATTTVAPAAATGPAQELTLKPDAVNPMAFNAKSFSVKAGQPVKLTFDNAAAVPLPHNVIVGKAGSKDALMAAAMKVATDPQGMAKGYVPEDANVLAHTKLVQPGQKETIEFVLPTPGAYPYMCTFPGHSIMMNGVITAE